MPLDFYLTLSVVWIIPSVVTAIIAARKGRSFVKWLLIGLVFSPLPAILMALILRSKPSGAIIKKYAEVN